MQFLDACSFGDDAFELCHAGMEWRRA